MISIVIPVYNAAQYLPKCLDSLISQTYKDWEAILIDDGSSDVSAQICKQYATKDERISFILKENEGVSKTRNKALGLCKGCYVFFLDADDYLLDIHCLSNMEYTIKSQNVDLVRIEYCAVDETNKKLFDNRNSLLRRKYYNKPVSVDVYCDKVIKGEYFLCLNLLRNEIVQKQKIRFLEGCRMREDAAFLLEYLSYCKKAIYLPDVYYAYRKHNGAATANNAHGKYSKDLSMVFDSVYAIYQRSKNSLFKSYLEYFLTELTVDLRKSEYFGARYAICKAFHNKSTMFKCLGFGGVSESMLTLTSLVKRILVTMRTYASNS